MLSPPNNTFPRRPEEEGVKLNDKYLKPAATNIQKEIQKRNLTPNYNEIVKYYNNKEKMQAQFNSPIVQSDTPISGIPKDWDYKTAKQNWNGETLDRYPGAVGWTKFGEPYYGGNNPFQEWWRKNTAGGLFANIKRPVDTTTTAREEWLKIVDGSAEQAINTLTGADGEKPRPFQALLQGIGVFGQIFSNVVPQIGRKEGEDKPSVGAMASRFVGEAIVGLGVTVDALTARPFKQATSVLEGRTQLVEEQTGDAFQGAGEQIGTSIRNQLEQMPDNLLKSAGEFIAGAFENIKPVEWTVNSIRAGMVVERDVLFDADKMNWNAGRVLYSSFIDPAVKEEYKSRYLAGENPYLLELELQNPLAEAAGEIIFDPLNFIAAGAKGRKFSSTSLKSEELMATAVPEAARLENITDATRIEDLQEVAVDLAKANERIAGTVPQGKKTLLGKVFSPFTDMTPAGKQNHMNRLASHIISNDLAHVNGNPDRWYEIVKARAALASTDVEKRTKAIQFLISEGIPANNFMSEGHLRFSNLISNMYFDEAGNLNRRFLDGMLKTIKEGGEEALPKLLQQFDGGYQKAIEKTFPSIADEGNALLGQLEKISQREGKLGGVIGWVNSKAAQIWMNFSPSFAGRNWLSNKFHILQDFGVSGLVESFKVNDVNSTMSKVFGGSVPDFLQQGYGAVGKFVEPATAGEKVKAWDWLAGNLKRSGIYESNARKSASAYSIKQSWKSGKKVVLDGTILKEAGVPDDMVRTVQNILDAEYGNWDAALPQIKEIFSGDADYIKTLQWLDDQDKTWMRNYDVLDNLLDGVRAANSEEEALGALDNVLEQMRELARTMDDELILPDLEDATGAGIELQRDMERFAQFVSDDEMVKLFGRSKYANKIAEDGIYKVVQQLHDGTVEALRRVGIPKEQAQQLVEQVFSSNEAWTGLRNTEFLKPTHETQKIIADTHWSWANRLRKNKATAEEAAKALKISLPEGIGKKDAARYIIENVWYPQQRKAYGAALDSMAMNTSAVASEMMNLILENGGQVPPNTRQLFKEMFSSWQNAKMVNNAIREGGKTVYLTEEAMDNYQAVLRLAFEEGNILKGNVAGDNKHILRLVEQYTGNKYEKARDIELDVFREALENRRLGKEFDVTSVGQAIPSKAENVVEGIANVFDQGGQTISNGAPYAEALPELEKRFARLRQTISENWGRRVETPGGDYAEALANYGKQVKSRAYEWRNIATNTAKELGDFILHDYGDQRNIDLVLGLIYPYQFWYSRTYTNWLQRIARNPAIIARYYRYKDAMAKIHAGLPDYYKYQLNTNELFGLYSEHPLMFNLEATVNPLNALTGVDFDDPARRVNWWTKMLDGMGRFGPSMNPLIQYGVATALMAQGEEEAASHWAGRLLQQTSTLQTIGAMSGIDWLATAELDPSVNIFGGGTDPWLRNRTGKALAQMQQEGWKGYTPEEMFEAARTQEGEIWDQARIRAIQDRGWGQLASYFLGVGFKPLTQNDVEINAMYQELYGVLNMRENLTPSEYKQAMQQLNIKYPYMDTVLTSKKAGAARDTAYAWSVLGRIPPGDSREVYEMVGLDPDIVNQFYDTKGNMSEWAETDRDRFMASIIDMAAVLAMPDGMTQAKWDAAKLQYSQVTNAMKQQFGDGIEEQINMFYELKNTKGDEAAYAYLDLNPLVDAAMNFKSGAIVQGPLELQAYYSSLNKISSYYTGEMYNRAEQVFGENIFDISYGYSLLETKAEKTAYKNKYPQLEKYWDFIGQSKPLVNERVVSVYNLLPEGSGAILRPDFNPQAEGVGAQELFQQIQQPQDPYLQLSPIQWQDLIGEEAFLLALQATQRELKYTESRTLEGAAEKIDVSEDRLIQYVNISVNNTSTNAVQGVAP